MPDRDYRVFVDSNVLLYMARKDGPKTTIAEALFRRGGFISVQVLNEIANVARRKIRMSWEETAEFLEPLRLKFSVVPLSVDLHRHGLEIAARHQLSVYDGVIVATALATDCDVLLSEDMQHGMRVEGRLLIENPFLGS